MRLALLCVSPKKKKWRPAELITLPCFYCLSFNRTWVNMGHLLACSTKLHCIVQNVMEEDEINQVRWYR